MSRIWDSVRFEQLEDLRARFCQNGLIRGYLLHFDGNRLDQGNLRRRQFASTSLYVLSIDAQESTSRGHSDLVLAIDRQIFIFECKMLSEGDDENQRVSEAIAQIKSRGYADKYRDGVNSIYFIGAVFDGKTRNLSKLEIVPD